MEITELVRQLVQQVKLEKIGTVDLVGELNELFDKVKHLSSKLQEQIDLSSKYYKEKTSLETELERYRQEYVIPALELKKSKDELEYSNKDWQLERKYVLQENIILKELLSAVTATKTISMNGNGSYYTENLNKAFFPKVVLEDKK